GWGWRVFFFCKEEEGIGVGSVTGVQACALPILPAQQRLAGGGERAKAGAREDPHRQRRQGEYREEQQHVGDGEARRQQRLPGERSEERRVGKEGRAQGGAEG